MAATKLELRPDFAEVREVWRRFWAGELTERPALLINVPRNPEQKPPPRPHPYNLNIKPVEEVADLLEEWAAAFHWCGDILPAYRVTFAPDDFALMLGADMEFREEGTLTGWIEPFLDDYDREIRFRPEGKWFVRMADCVAGLRKRFDGRLLLQWTQLQGGLDALSAIRGPERLLMDLVTCPDDVKAALAQIDRALAEARDALAALYDIETLGSGTRHGMYHPGRVDVPQCDFSCMISTEMFEEFGVPSLRSDCQSLDAAEYHLDGPDAIRHLEAVCAIDKIMLIQWQPGAGEAAEQDWTDLYARIDRLGTGQLRSGNRDEVKRLWRNYRSDHLCIRVDGLRSPAEAEDFVGEMAALER